MEVLDKPKRYEALNPYIEETIEKISKNEKIEFEFCQEAINLIKDRIEKKNNEELWFYILEGLSLMKKIRESKKIYPMNKEMALEDLKIGQEIQSNIKIEMGKLILKGQKKLANEVQKFNYKLFEAIGVLRSFEEKEKIEEIEISLSLNEQKNYQKRKIVEGASILRDAMEDKKIKKVEKKGKNIGKKILYIAGFVVLLAAIISMLSIKKGKSVDFIFTSADFPEIPESSVVQRGNYDLKITIPEEFWDGLNKKKKIETTNKIAAKIEEKGYLMLFIYSDKGEELAKWVKKERTYIYR